ncbi:MAG: helix-turn-helix transcriptional regulator [Lachnospiraceae bacterium]|nr:helix-turn-helix transcriptional regulator [Lachnospiraceae bacterium]
MIMKSPLDVYSDLSEQLHYNIPDLRLYVQKDNLSRYGYAATCHWHSDLEFILVLDGIMDFYINGEIVHLTSNCGVFVNSNRLHYGFSNIKRECHFIAVVIHPTLIHQSIPAIQSYFESKFTTQASDFILLRDNVEWQKSILELIKKIQQEMVSENKNMLNLLAYALEMAAGISEYIKENKKDFDSSIINHNTFKMVDYIHKHYADNISIDDIASSGGVCRSKCCKLFNKVVGKTPNVYLTHYRIAKSCKLLNETDMSVSEIADKCGFQSASYFIVVFKKKMGISPQKYRKKAN